MTLIDILLTTIIITLFCLGVRTLFSDGMILHWVRKPFLFERHKRVMNLYVPHKGVQIANEEKYKKRSAFLSTILKPFILCVVCFASVWGGGVFIYLHGLHWEIIICCVSATFIIKVINDKVEF